MQVPSEIVDDLREIKSAYEQTEDDIASTRLVHGSECGAAINELRYAGCHLLKAIFADEDPAKKTVVADEITKAKRHCRRAGYDLKEWNIIMLSRYIRRFDADYASCGKTFDVIADYSARMTQFNQDLEEIARIRDEHQETRDEFYEKITEQEGRILAFAKYLTGVEQQVSTNKTYHDLQDARDNRSFKISQGTFYIGVIMALLAAGSLGWQVISSFLEKPPATYQLVMPAEVQDVAAPSLSETED